MYTHNIFFCSIHVKFVFILYCVCLVVREVRKLFTVNELLDINFWSSQMYTHKRQVIFRHLCKICTFPASCAYRFGSLILHDSGSYSGRKSDLGFPGRGNVLLMPTASLLKPSCLQQFLSSTSLHTTHITTGSSSRVQEDKIQYKAKVLSFVALYFEFCGIHYFLSLSEFNPNNQIVRPRNQTYG